MTVEQANVVRDTARRAEMNIGEYVAQLVANVPVLRAGGSFGDHARALRASSAELSTLSRNIHQLTALLRHGDSESARLYRALLDNAADEVRAHLLLASRALADLRPVRGKPASSGTRR